MDAQQTSTSDSMDTTPKFQYQPLAPGQIRLLQLTCCDSCSELHCTLTPVSIGSHPVYSALSYTWGRPEPYHKLFVDRHNSVLMIQNNLAAALNHFPSYIGKYLWIDAVCINQQDNAEKSDQVARMAQIYQQAEEVISWLGEEEGGSNLAMESIERYGGAALEAGILSLPPSVWKTWPEVGDDVPPELQEVKKRIFELFSAAAEADKTNSPEAFDRTEFATLTNRPYFSRLWIKQEVALARKIHLVCGKRTSSFEHLASAFLFFATYTAWESSQWQEGWLASPPKHLIMVETESGGWEVKNTAQPSAAIGPLMSLRRKLHQEKTRPTLFWLLKSFHVGLNQWRSSMCMDPRDKIFGLLGMVEDDHDDVTTPVAQTLIDYSQPVESVYETVARKFLRDGIIDTLLFCRADSEPSPNRLVLPSWVPDWDRDNRTSNSELSTKPPIPDPWGSGGIYRASGEKEQTFDLNTGPIRPGILVLQGTLVGHVSAVGTVWNTLRSPNSEPHFWFNVPGAQRLFAEVKSFLEDSSTYTAQAKMEATWRIPIGDRELHPESRQWQRATSERSQGMHQRITAARAARLSGDDIAGTHSYQSIMQATHDAKPFLLKGGKLGGLDNKYVGLCPGETRPGDVVAILFGATVPFVLRPGPGAGENGFKLVGEAYVYGIMDGEYVRGDCHAEMFILC